jgi:hypothetical protein
MCRDIVERISRGVLAACQDKDANKNIAATCGTVCRLDPRARSIFGLDVMITEDFHPMLLEITYSPDCHRACVQYPTFFSDVFDTLFLGKVTNFDPLFS